MTKGVCKLRALKHPPKTCQKHLPSTSRRKRMDWEEGAISSEYPTWPLWLGGIYSVSRRAFFCSPPSGVCWWRKVLLSRCFVGNLSWELRQKGKETGPKSLLGHWGECGVLQSCSCCSHSSSEQRLDSNVCNFITNALLHQKILLYYTPSRIAESFYTIIPSTEIPCALAASQKTCSWSWQ